MRERTAARLWLLCAALGFGALLAGLIYATTWAQRQLVREIEQDPAALAGHERITRREIGDHLADLEREVLRLAKLDDLKTAIITGDRDGLLEQVRPPLNRLRKSPLRVSRITLYAPDGRVSLRAHAPDSYGDTALGRRQLVSEALTARRIVNGLETEDGIPYLWAVTPIYENGRLLGALEIGSTLAPVVEATTRVTAGPVAVLGGTGSLRVIESSDAGLFAEVVPLLHIGRRMPTRAREVVSVRGRTYAASFIALTDVAGREAGTLVILSDASAITATLRRSSILMLAISAVGFAVATALLIALAYRLDRFYRSLEVRVDERTRELSALLAVAQTVDATPDQGEVLRRVTREVARALQADAVGAYLADPQGHSLSPVAGDGFSSERLASFTAYSIPLKGHRFLEEAWASRRPVFSGAPAADPRVDHEMVRRLPHQAVLFAPLVIQGACVGGLLAFWREPGRQCPAEELHLVEGLVGQAATVVANARLYRAAEEHAEQLSTLHEIGTALVSTLDVASVLDAIAGSAMSLIGAQRCAVFEFDPRDQRLYARATRGMGPEHPFMPMKLGQGAAGSAALLREPVFSPDVERQPLPGYEDRWEEAGMTLGDLVRQRGYRSILAVPLISKATTFGAICIYWDDAHPDNPHEVRLLTALAQQAAIAIENARLYEEARARSARMQRLTQLSHLVAASLDVQHVLDSVAEAAQDLLTADLVRLWIVDEEAGVLRLTAQTVHPELSPVPMSAEFPLGQGVVGWVVAHQTKRYVRNLRDDPVFRNKDWAQAAGLQSLMAVPLISSERAVGALVVLTKAVRELTLEEGELLDLFAANAATALEHARLYRGAQRAYEELAQTQAQLVRGATLRAVGELAAGAAHHLNNLLAVVVGRLELALESFDSPEIQYQLLPAQRAARDGADVVRRLTSFSRHHPEGTTLVSADLNQLAKESLEFTRPRWQSEATARGVQIDVSLESGPVPQVAADLPSIREVFVNLILNAVDAVPRRGQILIKTWAADHRVYCAVSDTGAGMSAEVQRRVLEPFFTTKGVKSTGLGLSVSYGIIQRHGGDLTIDSAEGQGTTMTFWLPVAESETAAAAPDTTETGIPALRILLIDDDAPVRQVMADLLGRAGHEVIQASDGTEGLARLREAGSPVNLVLTDLGMPGLTGWEVARAIKGAYSSLPVGLVTGWGEAPHAEAGDREAVDFILPKPVTPAAFRAAVARLRIAPEVR